MMIMPAETTKPSPDGEILRQAFPDVPESERPYTMVSYGLPFEKAFKKHADGFLRANRVYIIASKGLASHSDCVSKLEQILGSKHAGTWMGIPAHSPYDGLIPILDDIRKANADCLITLGGGSISDGVKLLSYALENGVSTVDDVIKMEQSFIDLTEKAQAGIGNAPRVSIVFVPTTLSGAEYSKYAGCTNPRNRMKVQFTHPGMYAKLLILDPELCATTPDWVWRSTGVRAIDHCVENICSAHPRPEVDAACERGLGRLVKSLLLYAKDPGNMDVRLESQLGCNNAMTGLALRVLPGASHGIGHNLGPLGVGHGHTSCVLLPAVLKYNERVNQERQERIKRILWSSPEIASVLEKHGLEKQKSDAGDALRAVFDELGMPRSLKDVGVGRDKWDQLAENSLADVCVKNNPRALKSPQQVKEILAMCAGY